MNSSPDGLHLFTWGGTGARGSSCLRVWGLEVSGGAPCPHHSAQPRVATAALASPTSTIGSTSCVRITVTTGGVGPLLPAWGAEGALVFVPVDQALLVTPIDSRSHRQGFGKISQWTIKRHFDKVGRNFVIIGFWLKLPVIHVKLPINWHIGNDK